MPELLDTELTTLLRKNDTTAFKSLYQQSFPVVAAYVLQNNGSDQDAEDIFQEAIVILVQNLKKPDFLLTVAPTTYLYSVARNQWLKRLRDSKPFAIAYEEDLHGDMLLEAAASPPALAHQGHPLVEVIPYKSKPLQTYLLCLCQQIVSPHTLHSEVWDAICFFRFCSALLDIGASTVVA